MANTLLDQAIISVYNTGFFDYALPFIVTFAVLYGILQKTMFFGKENKKLNPIFALIVSLIVMPFAAQVDYTTYLAKLVLILIKFVVLAIVLGLFGYKFDAHKKYAVHLGLALTLLIVVTEFTNIGSITARPEIFYIVFIFAVFGLVYWIIARPSEEEPAARAPITPSRPSGATPARERIPSEIPGYDIEKVARIPGSELETPGKKFGE